MARPYTVDHAPWLDIGAIYLLIFYLLTATDLRRSAWYYPNTIQSLREAIGMQYLMYLIQMRMYLYKLISATHHTLVR